MGRYGANNCLMGASNGILQWGELKTKLSPMFSPDFLLQERHLFVKQEIDPFFS
jgi:hypothetical protein